MADHADCPAKALNPQQRQELAIEALAGTRPIRRQAHQHQVSRRFVYRQAQKAHDALTQAFTAADPDDVALLARWLREDVLALAGPCPADRWTLYDFLVAQLRARHAGCQSLVALCNGFARHPLNRG